MSKERAALEAEVKHLREQLAAYEAESAIDGWYGIAHDTGKLFRCDPRVTEFAPFKIVRKPTSTAHLEARDKQVWNEAMEEAARICEEAISGSPFETVGIAFAEAIRAEKKG